MLTAVAIANLKSPGRFQAAPNLYINVTPTGKKSWVFRYRNKGQRRELGLGPLSAVPFSEAKLKAHELIVDIQRSRLNHTVASGFVSQPVATRNSITYEQAVDEFYDNKFGDSSRKQDKQWRTTLHKLTPDLGKKLMSQITTREIANAIRETWEQTPVTGQRLRGRLEALFGWAIISDYRTDENPALTSSLQHLLKKQDNRVSHFPSLPHQLIKEFMTELGGKSSTTRCLQMIVLTGQRSGQWRKAQWSWVDLKSKTVTFPAEYMKLKKQHVISLTDYEIELLKACPRIPGCDLIFPNSSGNELSDMALTQWIRKSSDRRRKAGKAEWRDPEQLNRIVTVHGMRSTFKNWSIEMGLNDQAGEFQLHHKCPDAVKAAYLRTTMFDERKKMMAKWVHYCTN